MLTRAIRKAVDANVRKWSYVKGILRSLLNQGIKTVKEWEQNDSGGNRKSGMSSSPTYDTEAFAKLGYDIPEIGGTDEIQKQEDDSRRDSF